MPETIGQKTGEREGVKQIAARHARRRAHANELQHGIRLHHRAHGVVRIPGSYSTARCATAKHPSNAKCARKPGHYRAQQSS